MCRTVEQIIQRLKKSPVFAISLSSKELFHSNFWAWLIETRSAYAQAFFPSIADAVIENITREEGNRDLTLWMKDHSAYVIENKLKSIPYMEQLEQYTADLNNFQEGLLTGIIACELPNGWNFRNYQNIGEAIKKIAEEQEPDGFQKQLITEYAEVMILIYHLLTKVTNEEYKNTFITDQLNNTPIEALRFDDVVKKLQAEKFAAYLKEQLNTQMADRRDVNLTITSGFSHKNAMVNIFYEGNDYNVGVTIQGNQFRRVISGTNQIEAIYQFGIDKGYFAPKENDRIFGKHTKMKNDYCKYNGSIEKQKPARNRHVYQHWSVENSSFEALSKEIIEQMRMAAKCI